MSSAIGIAGLSIGGLPLELTPADPAAINEPLRDAIGV